MKKFRLLSSAFLAIVAISLTSCEKYKCIKGNGNIVTKSEDLTVFDKVYAEGSFDVEIINDTSNSITIRTDDNIIQYINTSVVNNELLITVTNNRCLRSKSPIRILVYCPSVSKAEFAGSGTMSIDSINAKNAKVILGGSGEVTVNRVFADNFDFILEGSGEMRCGYYDGYLLNNELIGSGYVNVNNVLADTVLSLVEGSGEISLYGYTNFHDIILDGSGYIYSDELDALSARVELEGSGLITVNAINSLRGSIIGSGTVLYRTFPKEGAVYITVEGSGVVAPL